MILSGTTRRLGEVMIESFVEWAIYCPEWQLYTAMYILIVIILLIARSGHGKSKEYKLQGGAAESSRLRETQGNEGLLIQPITKPSGASEASTGEESVSLERSEPAVVVAEQANLKLQGGHP